MLKAQIDLCLPLPFPRSCPQFAKNPHTKNPCLQDPVDSKPAVLVKRFNVTKQKELEVQLSIQKDVLQR